MTEKNLISIKQKEKSLVLLFVVKFLICVLTQKSLLLAWVSLLFIGIVLKGSCSWITCRRESFFEQHLIEFLNLFLLHLKSGKGSSLSFQLAIDGSHAVHREKLKEIYNYIFFADRFDTRTSSPFINKVVLDLSRAIKAPQNATKLVGSLRDQIKATKILRERVQVMTQPARTQAIFLVIFYVGLAVFSGLSFGLKQNLKLFLCSLSLFLIGLIWLLQIGKGYQWQT